jgi:hypothetical protein
MLVLDAIYPQLVEERGRALVLTSGNPRVSRRRREAERCVRLASSWKGWIAAFPQHGRGRKHTRPICLEPWQQTIVDQHPWAFLRGLLHSDGRRTYPRWFSSNLSDDIRRLFCETCERLGVRWTQSNPRNISVSHRESVAILERIVGPKT